MSFYNYTARDRRTAVVQIEALQAQPQAPAPTRQATPWAERDANLLLQAAEPEGLISSGPTARQPVNGPRARPADLVIAEAATHAVLPTPLSNPGEEKPVSMANLICKMLDDTGLAAAPCFIETGRNRRVVATFDMDATEVRGFCSDFTRMLRDNETYPTPGWSLHIRSPYSGDSSIAFCSF